MQKSAAPFLLQRYAAYVILILICSGGGTKADGL